jgi:hypothetical protein
LAKSLKEETMSKLNDRFPKLKWATCFVVALFLFVTMVRVHAAPAAKPSAAQADANQVPVDAESIGGVVTGANGPEAGVWVIAETTDLSTKFRKIVVTDDRGRYLLPQLPKARYNVWVRGYGLIDSPKVMSTPGTNLALKALIAPNERAAAQYYPADYWYSLAKIPDASEFPGTGEKGNGINENLKTQSDWVWQMKAGCETCHQIGDKATRELEPQLGVFNSSMEAWDHRVQVGQDGAGMSRSMNNYGRPRGLGMLSDWTDRIGKGELPPAPSRPTGMERNIVLTSWEWGTEASFTHDELSTDKRHPTVNANGPIYGIDWANDDFLILDPVEHTASRQRLKVLEDGVPPGKMQGMPEPSPYWGNNLYWYDPATPGSIQIDTKGRVWMAARFRRPDHQPTFCASEHPSAKAFPIPKGWRQLEYYDPKTKKVTFIDTCYDSHHIQIGEDEVIYSSGAQTGTLGFLDVNVLDATGGNVEKAQGWCGMYFDENGNGKYDEGVDQKVTVMGSYGVAANPKDHSAWEAVPGVPGKIVRVDRHTCATEIYEPPYRSANAPGKISYGPRGIDVDTNGIVWTALAGSNELASFDRDKCKVKTGPAITDGQHCPEGWTTYPTPGPKFKGTDIGSDYHYYNWVDRYNTLGLGNNTPMTNGTGSDSLLALNPATGKYLQMRVPYPMGFYQRSMDGRIDDPNGGWKGRGVYADYGPNAAWHIEPVGTTAKGSLVKFQIRPDPLAK